MALQVWLPLNGDLHNQGLSDVTVTNNGATVSNAGKIGKCYEFDGNGHYLQFDKTFENLYAGDFSWALWVKPTDDTRSILISEYASTGASNVALELYTNRRLRIYWNAAVDYYPNYSLPKNVWTHVAVTRKGTLIKVYINGELIEEKTGSFGDRTSTSKIRIGDDYRGGTSVSYKGFLNDVRIYDHALSKREVKDIAKGLVLHYKLDEEQAINLNPFSLTDTNYNKGDYASRTTGTISNNIYHVSGYQSSSSADTSFWTETKSYIALQADTDYYLSFWCKSKSDGNLYFGTSGGSHTTLIDSSNTKHYPTNSFSLGTNFDGWVNLKIHTGSDTQYKIHIGFDVPNIYGVGSYIEFSNIMLSLTQPSSYIPYNYPATILDCSGYNNDGTITGALSSSNDSPRYDKCILADGSSSYSSIVCPNLNLPDGPTTLSFWSKPTVSTNEDTSKIELTFSKIKYFTYVNYPYFIHDSDYYYKYINYWSDGLWHYVACVYTGSGLQMYIDGNLISPSVSTTTTNFSNSLNIKFRKNNLSDLRIYATALSADDIKELYNTPAMIDKGGNLNSFQFNDVDENIFKLEYLNEESRFSISFEDRNGEKAVPLPANYFYYGSGDARNVIFKDIFKPNTQYKFDFWIDYDGIVYDNVNRQGGIIIIYTDGTVNYSLSGVGDQTNPIGWQHKKYVSDAGKSIKGIGIYYWTSSPAYYRWDSIIMPMNTKTQIKKTGIGLTGQFRENTNVAQICRGDHIDSNQLIEI